MSLLYSIKYTVNTVLIYHCSTGTPMIPVHVGIMTSAPPVMVPSVPVVSKPPVHNKDFIAAKESEGSGPTTTVFVGNISEKASDMLIRQLLAVRNGECFTDIVCISQLGNECKNWEINIYPKQYNLVCH